MSGQRPTPDGPDGLDVLAGEFVLGLLDDASARTLLARSQTDPVLAAAIAAWQERLDPLADLPAPLAPREHVWARIEAGLKTGPQPPAQTVPLSAPARPTPQQSAQPPAARAPQAPLPTPLHSPPSRAAPWRGLALASMALAACLTGFIVWQRAQPVAGPPGPQAEALLATPGEAAAALRVRVTGAGTMTIVPLHHLTVAPDRRLGFWAWPASEKAPVLLGMISADGGQVKFPYPAREGTPVMVTSEPLTPMGPLPGPTLYLGLLVVSRG